MNDTLTYKGYVARVSIDDEADLFIGEVLNIRDMIGFHGDTLGELKSEFANAIDSYLEFCDEVGQSPNKPYSGKLVLRLPVEIHGKLDLDAKVRGVSINQRVVDVLTSELGMETATPARGKARASRVPGKKYGKGVKPATESKA